MLALPGGAYLYQGDELGLPEVEDITDDLLQDPIWERSGHTVRGRDGSRVPMPWSGTAPPFGFTRDGVRPWLPQPDAWRDLSVEAQVADPVSTLSLHRSALRVRRETPGFRTDDFAWRSPADGVLDFDRGAGVRCVVNLGPGDVTLDTDWRVLLTSTPVQAGVLPPDTTAWLRAR
jgi:alpha-glucosidase